MITQITEVLRRTARAVVPRRGYELAADLADGAAGLVKVGFPIYTRLTRLYPSLCAFDPVPVRFDLPGLLHPIYVRPGTTDPVVIVQNIIREEWGAVLPEGPIDFIIDAGANIGDTTAWYLSRFPGATVIALEPDPENYAMLVRNCSPYGPRAVLLNAALWWTETKVRLGAVECFDGISVTQAGDDDSRCCDALSIDYLLKSFQKRSIDLLKCDIEGAEGEVFSKGAETWLPLTRCIALELHGTKIRKQVYSELEKYHFKSRTYRNTHGFWRT